MVLVLFSPFLFGIINNWTNFSFYHTGTWTLCNQVWGNPRQSQKNLRMWQGKNNNPIYTGQRPALGRSCFKAWTHKLDYSRWEKCHLLLYNMTTRWEKSDIFLYNMTTRWEKRDLLLYNMTTRWKKCDLLLYNMTTIFWKDFMKFMLS